MHQQSIVSVTYIFLSVFCMQFFFAKNQICIEIFSHQIELQGKGRPFLIGDQKGSLFSKGREVLIFFSAVEPTPEFDNHPLTFLIDLLFVFHLYKYLKLDFVSQNRVQRTKPHRYFIF